MKSGVGGYPTILFGSLAKVHIYRGPIIRLCRTKKEVVQEVRDIVVHEIGYHFGLDGASREIVAFTTIADGCISAWAISRRWSSSDGSVTRILVSTKPGAVHLDPLFIRGSDATIRLTLIASSCDLRNDGGPGASQYLSEIECNGSG